MIWNITAIQRSMIRFFLLLNKSILHHLSSREEMVTCLLPSIHHDYSGISPSLCLCSWCSRLVWIRWSLKAKGREILSGTFDWHITGLCGKFIIWPRYEPCVCVCVQMHCMWVFFCSCLPQKTHFWWVHKALFKAEATEGSRFPLPNYCLTQFLFFCFLLPKAVHIPSFAHIQFSLEKTLHFFTFRLNEMLIRKC